MIKSTSRFSGSAMRARLADVCCIALFLLMLVFAALDAERTEREDDTRYCRNVHAGHWGDYKAIYADVCTANGYPKVR